MFCFKVYLVNLYVDKHTVGFIKQDVSIKPNKKIHWRFIVSIWFQMSFDSLSL